MVGVAWRWPTSPRGQVVRRTPGLAVAALALAVIAGSAVALGGGTLAAQSSAQSSAGFAADRAAAGQLAALGDGLAGMDGTDASSGEHRVG